VTRDRVVRGDARGLRARRALTRRRHRRGRDLRGAARLAVVSAEPGRRGCAWRDGAQFGAAFGVSLGMYDAGEGEFRSYGGALSVPGSLADRSNRFWAGQPRVLAVHRAAGCDRTRRLPATRRGAVQLPGQRDRRGQCIALLEFGGGYHDSDIAPRSRHEPAAPGWWRSARRRGKTGALRARRQRGHDGHQIAGAWLTAE